MKKGFTLMELLGSVVIMSIVLTIATISVISVINSSKQKAYNTQVQLIVSKAKDWALNNETKLTPNGGINFIELSTLVSTGYVDNSTISDPRNGSTMAGCVVITYDSKTSQYEYKYSDSSCAVEQEKYGPTWTSTNPTTVEVGTTFEYGVVEAISQSSGHPKLTVTGPTIDIVDGSNNVIKTGEDVLDTSYVGRIYSLTYYAYDPIYKTTFKNKYYVKVADYHAPIITIGSLSGTEKRDKIITDTKDRDGQADIYVLTENEKNHKVIDMIVNDNSCDGLTEDARSKNNCGVTLTETKSASTIDLTKALTWLNASPVDITYTATDSSGNSTRYTLHYYVAPRSFTYAAGDYYAQIYYPATYTLTGSGAQGANSYGSDSKIIATGGLGLTVTGTKDFNVGDIIHISVGNVGGGGAKAPATHYAGNGGKSTTITRIRIGTSTNANETFIVAAGGGGAGILSGGTNANSGHGEGGDWPKVCSESYGTKYNYVYDSNNPPQKDNSKILVDGTDTTSSGDEVCSTKKKSNASPNPPSDCSSATGKSANDGSGGGGSGTLYFSAHQCEPKRSTCKIWNECRSSACGCEAFNDCRSCNFGCASPINCESENFGDCKSRAWACSEYEYIPRELKCPTDQPSIYTGDGYDIHEYNDNGVWYGCSDCSVGEVETGICDSVTARYVGGYTNYNNCIDGGYTGTCTHYPTAAEYLGNNGRTYSNIAYATKWCGCNGGTSEYCHSGQEWYDGNGHSQSNINTVAGVCGCKTYYSCQTAACGCKTYNYYDGGYNYTYTSDGYGGQGGMSATYNGLNRTDKGNQFNSGDGKASITVN